MDKMDKHGRNRRLAPIHGFLAAAVLALAVMPIAFAGASPTASSSGALTAAKFAKLKQRVVQLENRGTPQELPPSGPAGGDLTGTYPNPTIAAGKVNSAKVEDNSIASADINANSLVDEDLAPDSVGSSEFKGTTFAVSGGVGVAANTSNIATVTCPGNTQLIAGGYAWQNDVAGTSIIGSTPSEQQPSKVWVVQGRATAANTLFAWATCLVA